MPFVCSCIKDPPAKRSLAGASGHHAKPLIWARRGGGGGGRASFEHRGGEGGRGFRTQNLVYQKWPDQIFPIVNFVFSHDGHFGLGRGGGGFGGKGSPPPSWFLIILKKPWEGAPRCHKAEGLVVGADGRRAGGIIGASPLDLRPTTPLSDGRRGRCAIKGQEAGESFDHEVLLGSHKDSSLGRAANDRRTLFSTPHDRDPGLT